MLKNLYEASILSRTGFKHCLIVQKVLIKLALECFMSDLTSYKGTVFGAFIWALCQVKLQKILWR